MAIWKFVLAEPGGGGEEIIDLSSATSRTYSADLLEGSTASFSLLSSDPECQMISVGAHDLKVYRENTLIDRLRIISAQRGGGDDSSRSFTCVSYKQMLDKKKLRASDTVVTTGVAVGTDFEAAAWSLISLTQSRDSVDTYMPGAYAFGITQGGIGVGRVITTPKYFDPGTSVREAIDDMAQTESTAGADDSWDWDIVAEGDDLVFYAWATQRGKTTPTYYLDNHTNVIDFEEDFDFSEYANLIVVQGSAGADQTYVLNGGNSSSGTFNLSFNGYSTTRSGSYTYAVSLSTFTSWLEALPSIGQGNVEVTGPDNLNVSPYKFVIRFTGRLAKRALPALTMSSTLAGGAGESLTLYRAGSVYTKTVTDPAYTDTPYGIVEYYHYDDALADTYAVDERANYLLKIKSNYSPSFSLDLMPQDNERSGGYDGPGDFWLGDKVVVDLRDTGYEIYRDDLRVSSIDFSIGEDGDESISTVVEVPVPIDRTETNLARRVAARELAEKKRQQAIRAKIAALHRSELKLAAQKKALEKYYHTHGNKHIDKGHERNKVNALAAKIKASQAAQKKLHSQL